VPVAEFFFRRAFPRAPSRVVGRVFLPPTIEQRVLFGASAFTTD
jgi:hypothetical protein